MNNATTNAPLSVGTAVPHMDGCACQNYPESSIMIDERAALGGLLQGSVADQLLKKLRAAGVNVMQYSRPRWNANGEGIGPEMTVRYCEAILVWKVMNDLDEALDRAVSEVAQRAEMAR